MNLIRLLMELLGWTVFGLVVLAAIAGFWQHWRDYRAEKARDEQHYEDLRASVFEAPRFNREGHR